MVAVKLKRLVDDINNLVTPSNESFIERKLLNGYIEIE